MDAVLDSFLPLRDAALSERRRIMDDETNKLKAKPVHQCPEPEVRTHSAAGTVANFGFRGH
jgi:hypothetical protein